MGHEVDVKAFSTAKSRHQHLQKEGYLCFALLLNAVR